MVRYNYIPLTPKDAYTGKYVGLEKRRKSLLHFSMKHGIMITDNKIELSPMGIDVLNGATTTDISGIPCVFYSSCLYEHDSRENTKRQEASGIR